MIAKAITPLALACGLLVKIVLHFYVFFNNFHNTGNNLIFIHFICKINGSGIMRNVPGSPGQSTVGAGGMDRQRFFYARGRSSLGGCFFFLDLSVWHLNLKSVSRFRFLLDFILKLDALVTLRVFLCLYNFILFWLLSNALFLLLARQTLV